MRLDKTFGPSGFQDESVSTSTCNYYLIGSSTNANQLRFKYLDFPEDISCTDLSLTIYESLSASSQVIKRICGEEMFCDEFTVGPLPRTSLAQFIVSERVEKSLRGFMAVLEEIQSS